MNDYSRWVEAFHRHRSADPNECVVKGISLHLDELPDPSLAHALSHANDAARLLDRLDEIRRTSQLDFDDALDADLAELTLKAEIHSQTYRFNGRTTLEQTPEAGAAIGVALFLLFANDPRPPGDRLADVTGRLEKIPEYLATLIARLDTPLERWVAIDIEKVRGLPQLFRSLERWAERVAWPDLHRLQRAREVAESALEQYVRELETLPTSRALHVGDRTARRIIALRGIEQSPEELRAIARTFLETTFAQIDELRRSLAAKYGLPEETTADGLQTFLNDRYRLKVAPGQFGAILQRYEAELRKITTFIEERDLFPRLEDQRLVILETPPFMAPSIPAGAMMSPPPFRAGTRTSLVYLTLSDALLDEHTELSIPSMMIHEGIPGHHLQLAFASRHPSVVRRHVDAMDQAEGWTTMLEDYMLDVGYASELESEVRFCAKRDICRLGARVAIDLFFMTGDRGYLEIGVPLDPSDEDPFVAAGALLRATTGFVPERVEAELNWYSQERGYPLSYLTGNHLVWELKRSVAKSHPDAPAAELDRRFFRAFLEAGSMPARFVARAMMQQGLIGSVPGT